MVAEELKIVPYWLFHIPVSVRTSETTMLLAMTIPQSNPGEILNVSLWVAQGLIFASLCTGGL